MRTRLCLAVVVMVTLLSGLASSAEPSYGPLKTDDELRATRDIEAKPVKALADECIKHYPFRQKPVSYISDLEKMGDEGNFVACLLLVGAYCDGLMDAKRDLAKAEKWLDRCAKLPHTKKERHAIDEQRGIFAKSKAKK